MKRAAILCLTDPRKARHGGSVRLLGFADILSRSGFSVEFICSAPLSDSNQVHSVAPSRMFMDRVIRAIGRVKRYFLPMPTRVGARNRRMAAEVQEGSFDLLLISEFSHLQFAKESSALLWLDFMDVWSRVATRDAAFKRGLGAFTSLTQARLLHVAEQRALRKSGVVTAAGYSDAIHLSHTCPGATWVPTWLPEKPTQSQKVTSLSGQRTAGFFGNFYYPPNRDAYEQLCALWLPVLRSAGWSVVVAGHGSKELLHPAPGIEILGALETVGQFYGQVDVVLAPIRLGGGIKVKILEALTFDCPVISTEFGMDGFPPQVRDQVVVVGNETPLPVEALHQVALKVVNQECLSAFSAESIEETVRQLLIKGQII